MAKRKFISKSARFDIFQRDSFACQYCGGRPPDFVLVLDHLVPVAEGGDNSEMNLITACEHCNQGKAAKILRIGGPSPDADLKRLKVEQEAAEFRRYLDAAAFRDEQESLLIARIQRVWSDTFEMESIPSDSVVRCWLKRYDPASIEEGIVQSLTAYHRGVVKESYFLGMIRYVSAVMRNINEGTFNA